MKERLRIMGEKKRSGGRKKSCKGMIRAIGLTLRQRKEIEKVLRAYLSPSLVRNVAELIFDITKSESAHDPIAVAPLMDVDPSHLIAARVALGEL